MSIVIILAVLLGGFTLFSALTLGITHLRREHYQGYVQSQHMGWLLLLLVSSLQVAHVLWLLGKTDLIHTPFYQVFLFASAPVFYWFSRPLLQAETSPAWQQLWHAVPVLVAPLLPFTLALPLAFALGLGYLAWLAYRAYLLRDYRERCRREMALLATAWLLAVGMGGLGLAAPWLAETLFFSLYTMAIGIALLLVTMALGFSPALLAAVSEAAQQTFAVSTLKGIDCAAKLLQLGNLMDQEQIFRESTLDLPTLAQRLELTPQQLAELLQTRLGKDFARYVREYRVEAAEDLLLDRPFMPIASVGLEVGFASQPSFYAAFRELTGTLPEQYRRLHQLEAAAA